ncbi:MAG: hypothetical protein JW939_05920 [Candidatus Thermoplasmatota archaeon]|nr:hypothetical protein [Candidatus Thermoplasmatota archaeon]
MKEQQAPVDLEMILEKMDDMKRMRGSGNTLGTVHLRTSILHGLAKNRGNVSIKLGRKDRDVRPELPVPFLTTASLMEHLPDNARLGIALGQAMSGIPINIYPGTPGEIDEILKIHTPMTMAVFGPVRTGLDIGRLRSANLIEIEIVEKNGPVKGLVPEVRKGKDIIRLVDMLRELSDVPRLMSIDHRELNSDIDFYLVSELDIIGLRCEPPPYGSCDEGMMLASVTALVRQMDVFKNREKGVLVMLNGDLRTPEDMVKLMALGVDLICLDHLTMEFLKAYLHAKFDIPMDINIDLKERDDGFDWAEIGELYSELMTSLSEGLRDTLAGYNIASLSELGPERLVTTDYNTSSLTGIPLAGFDAPVPFWRHRS